MAISRRAERGTAAPYRRGDQREQAILDSFEALLARKSHESIGNDEIAAGAGISRSTLYFYFGSKAQILDALLARTLQDLYAVIEQSSGLSDEPVEVAFRRVLEDARTAWRDHGVVLRAVIEADDAFRQQWRDIMAQFAQALADLIARKREERELENTAVEPLDLAWILCWMVERNYYHLYARPHTPQEEERLTEALYESVRRVLALAPHREIAGS